MRVLLVIERSDPSRYWSTAVPELLRTGVKPVVVTLVGHGELHSNLNDLGVPCTGLGAESSRDYPRAILALSLDPPKPSDPETEMTS